MPPTRHALQLGWGLGSYRFDRYKKSRARRRAWSTRSMPKPSTCWPPACACATWSTPRPSTWARSELEDVARELAASARRGSWTVIAGDALLAQNFPAIHAVGRASHRAPRLIVLRWGDASHPHVAIWSARACASTPAAWTSSRRRHAQHEEGHGRRGARAGAGRTGDGAQAAGAADLLVPAVENADRPGCLPPRRSHRHPQGRERGDRQHRCRRPPGAVRCAGLRGRTQARPAAGLRHPHRRRAHRAGPGPAGAVRQRRRTGQRLARRRQRTRDPLWRMPLWRPYLRYLTSGIADLANGRLAHGRRVTAALYLEALRALGEGQPLGAPGRVRAWNDSDRPGRPGRRRSAGARLRARPTRC
jgi:leucyl aminopeptidase